MRIVVAMSGGVDSSVAAALLARQGHDVVGLSMQLYDQSGRAGSDPDRSFGTCCTIDDLHDARRVAARLGIPHYIVNFEREILERVPGTEVNGARDRRVPNTSNISFDRVEAESLLIALDLEGIAVSTGSACSSGTLEPSHVLRAMNLPAHRAQNSIRFSLGAANTDADVDRVIAVLPAIVNKLRSLTRTPVRA